MARFKTVGVIGLGYVGLPLAVAFARRYRVVGFDLSAAKITAYRQGVDPMGEVSAEDMRAALASGAQGRAPGLEATTDPAALAAADVIIVAVPTPVTPRTSPIFPLARRQRSGRQAHAPRRHRGVRVHRLSRRHRGNLHPGAGAPFRNALEDRFQRRLFAGAHQPGRPRAHLHADFQGGLR